MFFFFQAEDGIRDDLVTGVQTCALPIYWWWLPYAIFFPRVILHNFFLFWLIYGGLGFWGWGLILGFWGWGFQLMEVWVLWCGPFWVISVGALYINIKE